MLNFLYITTRYLKGNYVLKSIDIKYPTQMNISQKDLAMICYKYQNDLLIEPYILYLV